VLHVFWDGLKLLVKICDIYWGDRPPIAHGLQLSPTSSNTPLEEKRSTAFHTRKAAKNSNDSRWLLEWESFISSQIRNRPPSCKLTVPAASVSALGTLSSLKSIRAETENTSSASFPGCSTHSINTLISQLNTKWIRQQRVTIYAAPRLVSGHSVIGINEEGG